MHAPGGGGGERPSEAQTHRALLGIDYVNGIGRAAKPTAPRRASAHVAGVEELEQTRDTLIAQLSEAQRAAEQRARQLGRERAQRRQMLTPGAEAGPADSESGPLERAMSWWRRKL